MYMLLAVCRAQQQHQQHCSDNACSCSHSTSSSTNSSKSQQQQQLVLPALPAEAAQLDPDSLPDSSITDKQLEKAILQASSQLYEQMASQGALLQRQLGNLYTASLYSGLAALIAEQGDGLVGKRILCFSFGSGVVSSMFVLRGRQQQQQGEQQQQLGIGLQQLSPNDAAHQQLRHQQCGCGQLLQQQAWRQKNCSLLQMADSVSRWL